LRKRDEARSGKSHAQLKRERINLFAPASKKAVRCLLSKGISTVVTLGTPDERAGPDRICRAGLCTKSPNPTHGSGWMLQIVSTLKEPL
jgi:hypothetical protein